MDRVKGKVSIVTGGAGGIGGAIAILLAWEGARIVITDINEIKGKEVAEEIKRGGGEAIFLKHDVTSENDWNVVIEKTMAEFGKLDILVNNAGILFVRKVEDTSLEEWRRLMSINLDGVFLGTKHAIVAMKKSGGGSIINISSTSGIVGETGLSAYCASKGAVRLFTKAVALECSRDNIRVNSIHPGTTRTPMTEALFRNPTTKKKLEDSYPIGHLGEPKDIAYAVLYLASDESKFVTGTELIVDGGWTAQ